MITWYIWVHPSHDGYTMSLCIHTVYTWYIHGIYMVYQLMDIQGTIDIHGISIDGYTRYMAALLHAAWPGFTTGNGYSWIFLDFWNHWQISRPARAGGHIQCAHVCGWSRAFNSMLHHGNCAMENRLHTKGSTRLLQISPLCSWQWWWRRRWRSCRWSLSVFLVVLLLAKTWILVKDGANGAFRASAHCVEQLRFFPVLKTKKN